MSEIKVLPLIPLLFFSALLGSVSRRCSCNYYIEKLKELLVNDLYCVSVISYSATVKTRFSFFFVENFYRDITSK